MVKARTWFALVMVSFGTIAATASCGSGDEATGNGDGGRGSVLGGGSGGTAARGGASNGAGSIGRAGAAGRGGSGSGGRTGAGGGPANPMSFGAECASDRDCAQGMTCITAKSGAFGDGGPSKGMCTAACTADGGECESLKTGAVCINFGTDDDPQAYCLDACELGDPLDLANKCAGRSDFVCANLGDETTVIPFCVPHCRSDAECGSGLFCDKSGLLGLCSTTKPTGDPVGTACTPGATPTTCAGVCIRTSETGVTPVTGSCIELCSAGFECMYGSGNNPSPGGFCGGQLNNLDFGALDLGYCLANCSCTSDCKLSGDLCRKWPAADADLATALGADGVCYGSVAQSTELTCGAGGAGGDGAGGDSSVPNAGASGSGI